MGPLNIISDISQALVEVGKYNMQASNHLVKEYCIL